MSKQLEIIKRVCNEMQKPLYSSALGAKKVVAKNPRVGASAIKDVRKKGKNKVRPPV